jgi:hypothetical protein
MSDLDETLGSSLAEKCGEFGKPFRQAARRLK